MNKDKTGSNTSCRNQRRMMVGKVVAANTLKTVKVQLIGKKRHPRYEKIISTRTNAVAHNEIEGVKMGDTVKIMSCRPMSRTKRWIVLEKIDA